MALVVTICGFTWALKSNIQNFGKGLLQVAISNKLSNRDLDQRFFSIFRCNCV